MSAASDLSQPSKTPQPSATGSTTEWFDKKTAAKELKKSERTLLEWVQTGKYAIQTRKIEMPSGQTATEFHAGDIARIVHDRDNPKPKPALAVPEKALVVQKSAVATLPQPVNLPQPAAVVPLLGIREVPAPCAPWQFMTVEEAAAHVRAPKSVIEVLLKKGTLPGVEARNQVRGGWLILRRDLESLELTRYKA
jgi:hypothetical protein